VLWPFVSASTSPEARSFALRPLVAVESSPGRKQVEALWPIVSYRRDGDDRTFMLRPLFYYKHRVRSGAADREIDTDWSLFPLVFGGRDNKEGAYFAILPLGGTLKGQLGKKQISFFLWPLWMSTRDARYDSVSVMWPFLTFWKGPDQCGRRLWPFYGVNRREGRFDRRFYLWPFVARWKSGLDTRYPGEAFLFFPFFGRVKTAKRDGAGALTPYRNMTTVLWPLFSRLTVAERNLDEVHAPWPFIGAARADGLAVRKLWPIWGERKSNDRRDRFVAWPLYRRSIWHEEDREHRWQNVGLVFVNRLQVWVDAADGATKPPAWPESFTRLHDPRIEAGTHAPWPTAPAGSTVHSHRWVQLWPLFHYQRHKAERVSFQFLSLLPGRSAAAETLYAPFYTLYHYERDATRQKRESFAFGLFRHYRRPEADGIPGMRYVNLAGIVSYHRRTGIGRCVSVLGGLIGYERVGTRRKFRLLWVPFGRIPPDVRAEYEAKAAGMTGGADGPTGAVERSGQQ
jgi:hypothetical protein